MKKRLDILLTEKEFFPSREKAKAVIMAGQVYINGQKADKPGMDVAEDADIEVRGDTLRYVSRGGLKLEKAMQVWPIVLQDQICMDIGASTGGFTDCMLQNGASKVYSVDVGYGQFAWKLRQDPRVVCMEKTNIRYVTPEDIDDALDFASVDVSFIWKSWNALLHLLWSMDFLYIICLIPQSRDRREILNIWCTLKRRKQR